MQDSSDDFGQPLDYSTKGKDLQKEIGNLRLVLPDWTRPDLTVILRWGGILVSKLGDRHNLTPLNR